MKKQFLASILAGAIVCNSGTLVFAKENNKDNLKETTTLSQTTTKDTPNNTATKEILSPNLTEKDTSKNDVKTSTVKNLSPQKNNVVSEKKEIQNKEVTSKDTQKENKNKQVKEPSKENNQKVSFEDHQELIRAIEEMREAGTILESSDLTQKSKIERMNRFSKAALQRIQGISTKNLPQNFKDNISFVKSTGEKINETSYNILRLSQAINNVEIVFTRKNETLENKNNVLDTLDDVINQEKESGVLNKATLKNANDLLHKYIAQLPKDDKFDLKAYNLEQGTYAIEEMKEACKMLDKGDLTKQENYERMIRFATASLDRSRALTIAKDSELVPHIQWIEESGDSIRNITDNVNNLVATLKNTENVFNSKNKSTREQLKTAHSSLKNVIDNEEKLAVLNRPTLDSAHKALDSYFKVLSSKPTTEPSDFDDLIVEPTKPGTSTDVTKPSTDAAKPDTSTSGTPTDVTKPSDTTKPSTNVAKADTLKHSNSTNVNKPLDATKLSTSTSGTSTEVSKTSNSTIIASNSTSQQKTLPRTGGANASGLTVLGVLSTLVGIFLKK
ncbi:MAG: LPXTG cell wall anchor domain-containing protein [Sarcina sp.]